MEFLDLPPMLGAAGSVRLPGSKSISNRVLLLAALAEGETDIRDLLLSDDVERMLEALRALGVDWRREGDSLNYRVRGVGGPFPVQDRRALPRQRRHRLPSAHRGAGASGGEYRLSACRACTSARSATWSSAAPAGADITCTANEGYPPLHLKPATIRPGGVVRVRGDVSSQFLTALLMALPLTGVETTVEVIGELISKPYIRITLELMGRFGVQVEQQGWARFVVPGRCALPQPGHGVRRGRCLVGVVLPRRRRDRRRAGAGRGRGPVQHPGRRALRRGARSSVHASPWATTGSRPRRPRAAC